MGETDMRHKRKERSCVSTEQLQVVTSPYVRELLAEGIMVLLLSFACTT